MLDVFVCVCVPTNIGLFNNEFIWDIWLPCLTFYLLWRLNQFNSHCKLKYNETREKSKFWPRMDINSVKTRARLHPKFESIDLPLIKEILWMLAIEIVTKNSKKAFLHHHFFLSASYSNGTLCCLHRDAIDTKFYFVFVSKKQQTLLILFILCTA